ncbi:MAG TPA: PIN domain-containing protein [Parapedobacter sp.]|uniref:PIN domain-containing protein n=1 Tax=Parapedobacter sp. TaxID=1958893 RepID=UPI002D19544B|nr:PIN domain-containing protein [Parapedobacter sp.]HWK57608.1 PIN domain-containing protein [Parapedobacter sp.]
MVTQKIICDTDVLIEFFDENKTRHSETAGAIEKIGINNMLISAISKMELIKGTRHKEHSQQVGNSRRFDSRYFS